MNDLKLATTNTTVVVGFVFTALEEEASHIYQSRNIQTSFFTHEMFYMIFSGKKAPVAATKAKNMNNMILCNFNNYSVAKRRLRPAYRRTRTHTHTHIQQREIFR